MRCCTVSTIWHRNLWYSSWTADGVCPSMCWKISAPSAAYATKEEHSKRCGTNLQKRAAHFLDSFFTLIVLFAFTDIFVPAAPAVREESACSPVNCWLRRSVSLLPSAENRESVAGPRTAKAEMI